MRQTGIYISLLLLAMTFISIKRALLAIVDNVGDRIRVGASVLLLMASDGR